MSAAGAASFGGWAGLAARLGVEPPSSPHRPPSRSRGSGRPSLRGGGDEGLKRLAGGGEGSRRLRGSGLARLGGGIRSELCSFSRSAAGAVGG